MHRNSTPHSESTEKSVLASMLVSAEALDTGMEMLKHDYFYLPHHRVIFDAIQAIYGRGESVDVVTITSELEGASEALQSVLYGIMETATTTRIEGLCKNLRSYSQARTIIKSCTETVQMCTREGGDVFAAVEEAEKKLFLMFDNACESRMASVSEIMPSVIDAVEVAQKNGGPTGLKTGFSKIDKQTTGMHPGELIILAARPGMGKTSFALAIAQTVAEQKLPVAFFSLEMPRSQLVQRMVSTVASVSMTALRGGYMSKDQFASFSMGCNSVAYKPIHIDDSSGISAMAVRSACRRLKAREGLSLVIVDYLQLMGHVGARSRHEEVGSNSRMLKSIAKELHVPVIALSQLSRSVEMRKDRRPMLSDLKESGDIEQDADVVLFLYRDDYYDANSSQKGVVEAIIGKQRNGPTGTVKLSFESEYTRFSNLEHRREPEQCTVADDQEW